MNLTLEEKKQYKKYGVNIKSKYFTRLYKQGLLDLTNISYEYITEIQSYYKKYFKYEIDTRDHIVFYNITGKKDVRIIPTSVLRGGAKGGYLINYFNDRGMVSTYNDKSLYDNIFKDFKRAYNVIKRVRGQYMTRDFQVLTREEALQTLLNDSSEYIIKQSDTDDGKTIAKLKVKDNRLYLQEEEVTLADLEKAYGYNFLVQRVIQQHPVMGKLHPSSVNTLRMVTLRWNGEIHYLYTFTRFGVNNDVKDNAGSGGLVVGVKDNGEFMPYGIYKNQKVSHHPTTQESIDQLEEVPNFEACKTKVKKMHERIIHHNFVSWDIAVTKEGEPIFIEVNFFGTSLLNQLALERPLFGELTEDILDRASSSFKELSNINTENFYSKLNRRYQKRNREYRELTEQNKKLKEDLGTQAEKLNEKLLSNDEKQGLIGMLRYSKQPNKNIEVAAKRANELNYDFVFFHPKDVDINNRKVNGLLYQEGEWVHVRTDYPDVVDNAKSQNKYRDIFADLEKHSVLTTRRIGNKDIISDQLIADKIFAPMVIPYKPFNSIDQILKDVEQYGKVVIKPTNQRRGRNIHLVMKYEEEYVYYDGEEGYSLDKDALKETLSSVSKRNMIIQPFIHSMTKEGRPFDIRIHVRRNGKGDWEVLKIYPRLGELGSAFSTVNSSIPETQSIEQFLSENYEFRSAQDILAEINAFISLFPDHLQKNYSQPIDALGIDLGLDETGKLCLFEVNTTPDMEQEEEIIYKYAVDYMSYLFSVSKKEAEHIEKIDEITNGEKRLTLAMLASKHLKNQYRYMLYAVANLKGVEFFIFTPQDIDYDNKRIKGFTIENDRWVKKIYNYPDYIYDNLHRRGHKKYTKVYKEFESIPFNKTRKSINSNKSYNYNVMKSDDYLKQFLIPYKIVQSVDDVVNYINKQKQIIMKNIQGAGGSSVVLIKKENENQYKMKKDKQEFHLNRESYLSFLEERFLTKRKQIVQPYIDSNTLTGNPYDIRVHIMRDSNGEFTVAKVFPRIGSSEGIVSNIAEGGFTCSINMFLNKHIDHPHIKLSEIKRKMLKFANKFQERYPHSLDAMGLDLAIDSKGEMWVFEVNINRFSPAPVQFESAYHIISYGIYRAESF